MFIYNGKVRLLQISSNKLSKIPEKFLVNFTSISISKDKLKEFKLWEKLEILYAEGNQIEKFDCDDSLNLTTLEANDNLLNDWN